MKFQIAESPFHVSILYLSEEIILKYYMYATCARDPASYDSSKKVPGCRKRVIRANSVAWDNDGTVI